MKRSGKFYYKNEREVMESLGLKQVPGSGNKWDSSKEDGENDFVLCQLKSTDAKSIRIHQSDIRKLEEHALMSRRFPVFAIQFLNTEEVWLMAKPEDFSDVANYIKTGECEKPHKTLLETVEEKVIEDEKEIIGSDPDAREKWNQEQSMKRKKEKSAT